MKQLLLLSAVLISAATVAHAGVRVGFGVGLPLPALPLPGVVVSTQCAPAPVVVAQPEVCAPAPVVVAPAYPPARVYFGPRYYYPHRYAYGYGRGYYGYGYGHGYWRR